MENMSQRITIGVPKAWTKDEFETDDLSLRERERESERKSETRETREERQVKRDHSRRLRQLIKREGYLTFRVWKDALQESQMFNGLAVLVFKLVLAALA